MFAQVVGQRMVQGFFNVILQSDLAKQNLWEHKIGPL